MNKMQTREQRLRQEYRAAVDKMNFAPRGTLNFQKLVKEAHQKREELLQEQSAHRRHMIAVQQLNRQLNRDMTTPQKLIVIAIGLICLYLAFTL